MMPFSRTEQILSRVLDCLLNATPAGDRVERGRQAAYAAGDAPAINIKRDDGETRAFANKKDQSTQQFTVEFYAQGDDYETATDALHVVAHRLLLADPILAQLGKGLRCTNTSMDGDEAEFAAGRLTARYEIKFLTQTGDLAA